MLQKVKSRRSIGAKQTFQGSLRTLATLRHSLPGSPAFVCSYTFQLNRRRNSSRSVSGESLKNRSTFVEVNGSNMHSEPRTPGILLSPGVS